MCPHPPEQSRLWTPTDRKNKDGTYTLKVGDLSLTATGKATYNNQEYYNVGQNVYNTEKGFQTTGKANEKITTFFVTTDQLKKIFPSAKDATRSEIATYLNQYMGDYGIDTYKGLAHFLSQSYVETVGWTELAENLKYSRDNLCNNYASRYPEVDNNVGAYASNRYLNNEQNWGNLRYSGNFQNGGPESGDGFRYRGRGLTHLTWKENYANFTLHFQKKFGGSINFVTTPDLIATNMEYAVLSGLDYFKTRVNNSLDLNIATPAQVSRKVNGGNNNLKERIAAFNRIIPILH